MSVNVDQLNFDDLAQIELPFTKDDKEYVLIEASAAAVKRYQSWVSENLIYDKNGKPTGLKDAGRAQLFLLSLTVKNSDGKYVTEKELEQWSGRMVRRLFDKAKMISGLSESETPTQLKKALEAPESPVAYSDFAAYMKSLPKEEYGAIQQELELLETVKN